MHCAILIHIFQKLIGGLQGSHSAKFYFSLISQVEIVCGEEPIAYTFTYQQ